MVKKIAISGVVCGLLLGSSVSAATVDINDTNKTQADGSSFNFAWDTDGVEGNLTITSAATISSITTSSDNNGSVYIGADTTILSIGAADKNVSELNVTSGTTTIKGDAYYVYRTGITSGATLLVDEAGTIYTDINGSGIFKTTAAVSLMGSIGVGGVRTDVNVSEGALTVGTATANETVYADVVHLHNGGSMTVYGDANISTVVLGYGLVRGDDADNNVTVLRVYSGANDVNLSVASVDSSLLTNNILVTYNIYTSLGADGNISIGADYNTSANLGLSGNEAALYTEAIKVALSTNAAMMEDLNATDLSVATLKNYLNTLLPDVSSAGVGAVATTTSVFNTIGSHMKTARADLAESGIATGNMGLGKAFWVQGYYVNQDHGDNKGVQGYEADGGGVVFGLEKYLNDTALVGIAFSYGATDVSGNDPVTKSSNDIDAYQLTVYGSKTYDKFYVEGSLAYGINKNDVSRQDAAANIYTAEYDSQVFSARVGAGMPKQYNDLMLTPMASLTYTNVSFDSYTEKSTAGIPLKVAIEDLDKFILDAGVAISKEYKKSNGTLIPELKLGASYNMGDNYASANSSFVAGGGAFKTDGVETSELSGVVGAGLKYVTDDNSKELSFDYGLNTNSDLTSHDVRLTAKFKF